MTCDSIHAARRWVMNCAAQPVCSVEFRWGNARTIGLPRQVARVLHFQWAIEFIGHELFERPAARTLHSLAEQDEVNVAVKETASGRVGDYFPASHRDG